MILPGAAGLTGRFSSKLSVLFRYDSTRMSHLMNTYARLPVAFVRGQGAWLYDDKGRQYLDAISGIGVCSLGHAHPEIARVVCEQASTLIHTANLAEIPYQESLASVLCGLAEMDKAFVANSGAEAVECALKIARRVAHDRHVRSPRVLVCSDSFHGRTLATISASGSAKAQAGFAPLVEGFVRVPFGDARAAEQALAKDPDIVAILLEPIQGEAGIRIPPAGYLRALRAACDQHGALMICDEIQSGMCRTGRWFAYQHEEILPDLVTVAKALGNGIPVAACLARGKAAEALVPGSHGTTFGGNPLACRTALKVIEIMQRDGIAGQAAETGHHMLRQLQQGLDSAPGIREVRGKGLMLAVEMDRPATSMRQAALELGVLLNVTRENTLRLLPPLIIDRGQADRIVETIVRVVHREIAA